MHHAVPYLAAISAIWEPKVRLMQRAKKRQNIMKLRSMSSALPFLLDRDAAKSVLVPKISTFLAVEQRAQVLLLQE